MKAKYFIITLLVVGLYFIVSKMMKFEQSIREERIVSVKIHDETKALFNSVSDEQLAVLSARSKHQFTANGDYFEVLNTKFEHDTKKEVWQKIFLKGVNLGVALPGKYPAQFSLSYEEYLDWFIKIGQMNSNVIRTYTILPPEFYDALAYYNLQHQNKKLYLMQGVWAKIPDNNDYYNPKYSREFQKEIIDVIDLIHGKGVIDEKRGHASGVYVSDISKYVIGILLGREWEPMAVVKTNHANTNNHYIGKFINMNSGSAMESWLAKMMDFCVHYETQTYQAQRPISFVNWLPLDPLHHSCEFIESEKVREFDNDLETIDFNLFHSTDLFIPGIYASYHAYPYYPDFIYMEKKYSQAINKDGQQDNYYGYLSDLKKIHPQMPLVIAEYGLPSSRGNSHQTPLGLDQGGLSEYEHQELNIQLTKDIHDTRCAGAIYFEWIDEWFKHNWLVMDFEQPNENRKQWHNMENPEQNFGIYAYESRTKVIDGELDDWHIKLPAKEQFKLHTAADASYFYITANIPDFDFDSKNIHIALDVFDKELGDHKLPFSDIEMEYGIEFLVQLFDTSKAAILVDDAFSIYNDYQNDIIPVFSSKNNDNGLFIDQVMLTNRGKTTLYDSIVDQFVRNRGILIHGNSNNPKSSNADWFWNPETKILEMRLAWHLLNVSDPSQKYVLNDQGDTKGIEYSKTDGFNIFVFVTDKKDQIIKRHPKRKPYFFSWNEWETTTYSKRLKPIYHSFKEFFPTLIPLYEDSLKNINTSFRFTNFYNNKLSAVSLVFNDAGYTQITNALPISEKYYFDLSFAIIDKIWEQDISNYANEGSFSIKRFGKTEVESLLAQNHKVSSLSLASNSKSSKKDFIPYFENLEQNTKTKFQSFYFNGYNPFLNIPDYTFGVNLNPDNNTNSALKPKYLSLSTYRMSYDFPSQVQLDSILNQGANQWIIFSYQHFFEEDSKEQQLLESGKYKNTFSVTPYIFERQARILRNSDYWIAPVSTVGKYIKEKELSTIVHTAYGEKIFVNVVNRLDNRIFNHPLTVEFTTEAKKVRISGSANDGIYNNRSGKIYLNIIPNKEVTIEIIE